MKAQKKGLVFAVVLRIIGIFILMQGFRMIGEGVYNYINEHSQQDWITVSAEVVDVRSEYSGSFHRSHINYDITYQYEIDGKAYSGKLYNRSVPMGLGDRVQVKYDRMHRQALRISYRRASIIWSYFLLPEPYLRQ